MEMIISMYECGFLPSTALVQMEDLTTNHVVLWSDSLIGRDMDFVLTDPENCLFGGNVYRFLWWDEG